MARRAGDLLRITGVCALARLMVVLDIAVVAVAQRTFVETFHTTLAVAAWSMTGYTLALATVIPMAGWAAERFGTKRVFMASAMCFSVGSLLCAMSPNIALLIVFRVIEGLGGGMLLPLKHTILTRTAGPQRLGRMLGALAVPALLGPICGPVFGGWLIDSAGWQWIFLVNVPIGVAVFALAAIAFPTDRPAQPRSLDVTGMLLLSPGLAAFLFGASSIPGCGTVTTPRVYLPAAVGLVLIAGFVHHALSGSAYPLIDLRLFSNRVVVLANSAMLVSEAAVFGAIMLLPTCFQQLLHQTPGESGLHVVPQGLGAMLVVPIAGHLIDKSSPAKVVLIGIALTTFGMGLLSYGLANHLAYQPTLLSALLIMGMGVGCTLVPLPAAAMQALRPDQVARGATLLNVNLQVAASLGAALMSVIANVSHAYPVVYAAAAALMALACLPAMLLPRTPVAVPPAHLAVERRRGHPGRNIGRDARGDRGAEPGHGKSAHQRAGRQLGAGGVGQRVRVVQGANSAG